MTQEIKRVVVPLDAVDDLQDAGVDALRAVSGQVFLWNHVGLEAYEPQRVAVAAVAAVRVPPVGSAVMAKPTRAVGCTVARLRTTRASPETARPPACPDW